MKRTLYVVFLLLLKGMVANAQRIVFTPQWTPQSQFAGYYVAQEKGFYKEAGVEVDIKHPSASYSAYNRLLEGSSDIITMQLLQAMVEIDRGMPLVNVLQTSQHNGLMIVSRSDSIHSFQDLKGKKVGVWRVGFGDLGYIVDTDMNLNIQWIPFIQNINLYVSGAIDATLSMSYNEYLQIRSAGFEDMPTISFADSDYDFPEDGVYVTAEYYQRYPEKVKAFVEASRRGWEWVHKHPEETIDIVMKMVEKEKIPTNRIIQEWMLKEIIRLQCDVAGKEPSFELNRKKLDKLNELLIKHRRIRRIITFEELKGGIQ